MKLLHSFKLLMQLPQYFSQLPKLSQMRGILQQFVNEGAVDITTQCEYQRTFYFRTVIQLDGDLMQFIPPRDLYSDAEWQQLWTQRCQQHQSEVRQLLKKLNMLRLFTKNMAAAVGGLMGLVSWGVTYWQLGTQDVPHVLAYFVLPIVLTVGSALIFRYVIHPLIKAWLRSRLRALAQ